MALVTNRNVLIVIPGLGSPTGILTTEVLGLGGMRREFGVTTTSRISVSRKILILFKNFQISVNKFLTGQRFERYENTAQLVSEVFRAMIHLKSRDRLRMI